MNPSTTPLIQAIESGQSETVLALLLTADDSCGATSSDDDDKKLIPAAAAVNQIDCQNRTPLFWASRKGHLQVAKIFLQFGADVDHKDNSGWTPLLEASVRGHSDVVRLLLEHRANLEQVSASGDTPLRVAVFCKRWEVAKTLLEHGADIVPAFHLLLSTRGSVLQWFGQREPARTILSLKELYGRHDYDSLQVLHNWDVMVAFLWYHYFYNRARATTTPAAGATTGEFTSSTAVPRAGAGRPPLIESTANLSDEAFKNTHKWMIFSISSLLFRDNRLLRSLTRIYDKSVALEVCQHTGKTPLSMALTTMFPRWNGHGHALRGLNYLIDWNPLALRVRDHATTKRFPLAIALANSVPMNTIQKMVRFWPTATRLRDPATGLSVYLLACINRDGFYSTSDIYCLARDDLPHMIAMAVSGGCRA